MMYLIQGFFFQKMPRLGIDYDKGATRLVLQEVMERSMFSGVIGSYDSISTLLLTGRMTDYWGESELTVEIGSDMLRYTKIYDSHTDPVYYELKKNADGTWSGTFHGKTVGEGQARCILTPVPDDFLLPPME